MAIVVPIVSNFDGKGLNQAERRLEAFGRSTRAGFGRIADAARVATTAIAGIAAGASVAAFKAVGAAADIAESTSKVEVIFGNAAGAVLAFSKTADDALGLSQKAVLDAAGVFGTFGKAAGLTGTDLSKFTIGFTTLAADLASFNNTTPEEAIEAIGAGLRGEAEPLRRYGVLLDDARLKARALELGLYDGKGALDAQTKILAAQAEIFAQTSDAQGDFSRTSDGLANQSRILKANLANVVVEIGTALLPVALKIAKFINDRVIPAFETLSTIFRRSGFEGVGKVLVYWLKQAIPKVVAVLKDLGQALVDWIAPRIVPMLKALGRFIARAAEWMTTDGYRIVLEKAEEWGTALVDWIKPNIGPATRKLGDFVIAVGNWIVNTGLPRFVQFATRLYGILAEKAADVAPDVIEALGRFIFRLYIWAQTDGFKGIVGVALLLAKGFAQAWWGSMETAFAGAGTSAKRIANAIIRVFNTRIIPAINLALDNVSIFGVNIGKFFDIPRIPEFDVTGTASGGGAIPRMAKGGIVNSPTLAMIGEAGPEAVVPLNRLGGTGGNTYINVSGALDPVQVARQIRQILNDDARRTGRPLLV